MKTLFFFMMISGIAFADCQTSDVLVNIRPGAQWAMTNNDPSTLVWMSTQTIPSPSEIAAGIADCANQVNLQQRNTAVNDLLTAPDDRAKLQRAVLLTIFDENNNLREWIQGLKNAVAAATSLADLKTRVAALPDMPDRTVPQAKTAVQNKINSGASD